MPVTYTNRKGVTYTLYRGQTATGAPRYFFGRQTRGDPVADLPPGFAIRESPNGVVSLVKERPPLIRPAEVAAVEAAVRRHPQARSMRGGGGCHIRGPGGVFMSNNRTGTRTRRTPWRYAFRRPSSPRSSGKT
jgi:hypothetical protein